MRRNQRSGIGYLVIVVGLVLFAAGLFWAMRPVVCDNQAMQPGDRCFISSGSSYSTLNYEQARQSQRTTAAVLLVLGPAAAVGGIVILSRNRRRRR